MRLRRTYRPGIAPATTLPITFFESPHDPTIAIVNELLTDRESYERRRKQIQQEREFEHRVWRLEQEVIRELGIPETEEEWDYIDAVIEHRLREATKL